MLSKLWGLTIDSEMGMWENEGLDKAQTNGEGCRPSVTDTEAHCLQILTYGRARFVPQRPPQITGRQAGRAVRQHSAGLAWE